MADFRDENDAEARIAARIEKGENILWIGRPDPSVNFTAADGYLIPFSILWTAFCVFAMIEILRSGTPGAPWWFLILFIALGAYLVVGRFVYKRVRKQHTVYAITNVHALVLVGEKNFDEYPLAEGMGTRTLAANRQHMTVVFWSPPSGLFAPRAFPANTGTDWMNFQAAPPFAFYDVADVDGLQIALDQVQQERNTGIEGITNA